MIKHVFVDWLTAYHWENTKKSGKGENLQKEKAAIFALEDCLQVLQIFLEIDLFLLRS
jgi:hypothetical protein